MTLLHSISYLSLRLLFCVLPLLNISSISAATQPASYQVKLTSHEQAWIKAHPEIRVGGSPDWTPFNFVDANGQYSGIANDYLSLIARNTGLTFAVTIDQWSINLAKIAEKKIDLLGAVYYTEERNQYLTYSTPYFEVLDYFFIRDDLEVETLADLNGKRVAIPKSYAHIDLIKKHFPEIQVILVNTFGNAIDAVLENRADMLYDTYGALIYTLEKEGINTIIPFKSTRKFGKNPIHIVTRKDAPDLANIIQKGLNAITPQEKREIYNKWLSKSPVSQTTAFELTPQERDWVRTHPIVKYGAEKDWGPYDFIDEQDTHTGLSYDYLQLIGQRSGIKFEPVIDDWGNLLEKVKQQKIDLLPAIYFSPAREKFLKFTQPYLSILDYFFIHEDIKAITLDDLDGKIIAIPRGYAHLKTLQQHYPQLIIRQTDNLMSAIQSVIERKADILLESYAVINYQLKKNGIATIHPFKALGSETKMKLHMAVQQDQTILASILNKSLSSLSEAEKKSIHSKWINDQLASDLNHMDLSQSEQKWLADHPIIRFTGDPNWLPYEAFNQQGEYIGIVAEYLKLIEKKLGITVQIIPVKTWTEAVTKAKQGEIDILSETPDSDLQSHLHFTHSYISSPIIIVMKNNEYYVDSIHQIDQRKIALIKDYGYLPKIIKKHPEINFLKAATIQDGLTAVSTGKIDALIATLAQASYHISELGINNVRIVGKTEFTTQLAFGIRPQFEPLIALFNRALNTISQSEKRRIHSLWGKPKYAAKIDYTLLAKMAGITLLILTLFIYWNRKLAKEVALRKELESQTQALIDNIPLHILVTSIDGHILSANHKALIDYSIRKDEIADINVTDFYRTPSEREAIIRELAEQGKVEQKIIQFIQTDNTLKSMMISIMPINYHQKNALLTIAVDMTERLEMEAAYKSAKESAEVANHAKSEFLANMSHEIRTPMNAIIGFTELLNDQIDDPKLKSFVKTIQSAGNNLLALINDILDLSKIEAGKFQINKTACNPHDLFSELKEIFSIKMCEKDIDFIFDIDPIIPKSLQLDATRLRQVLLNIVGNAVKFTEQGSIKLKVLSLNENDIHSKLDLLIEVEDSGIGISKDQQQLIFQNFEQSNGHDTKKYGGTGLGLSISKRLVELMGGQISLHSLLGQGSTFTIKLLDVHIASLAFEDTTQTPHLNSFEHFLPANILIVDDIKDNRHLLEAIFANTKLHAVAAKNGLEAVELCRQQPFDLILMDIHMPVMDGYQATAEIKSFTTTPILALTASVMKDEFDRVKSEHFAGYLRKPMLKADLISELSRFLPFEDITAVEGNLKTINITKSDKEHLSSALDNLRKLSELNKSISKTNNISEIKNFTHLILAVTEDHPVSLVQDYAKQLKKATDSFDIATIKHSLNTYPDLLNQLEQLKVQNKP